MPRKAAVDSPVTWLQAGQAAGPGGGLQSPRGGTARTRQVLRRLWVSAFQPQPQTASACLEAHLQMECFFFVKNTQKWQNHLLSGSIFLCQRACWLSLEFVHKERTLRIHVSLPRDILKHIYSAMFSREQICHGVCDKG